MIFLPKQINTNLLKNSMKIHIRIQISNLGAPVGSLILMEGTGMCRPQDTLFKPPLPLPKMPNSRPLQFQRPPFSRKKPKIVFYEVFNLNFSDFQL